MPSALKVSVFDLLSSVLADEGIELVDVEHEGKGNRQVLRLLIYKPGGVKIEDCQQVSRIASPILGVHEVITGKWTLEVASPGVDRPLVTEADFRRNLGRQIQIEALSSTGRSLKLRGILKAVNKGAVLLNQPSGETIQVGISEITKAQIQLMW